MKKNSVTKDLDALNGRFVAAFEALGYTGYSLSKVLGTSEAVLSNIRTRKNPPNIMLVRELLNRHLELDPEWLLFGRGSLMRDAGAVISPATRSTKVDTSMVERLERLEATLERLAQLQLHSHIEDDEVRISLEERLQDLEDRMKRKAGKP
jgi:transcriptional regulator with XRE-family HTH domain